jgi:hypothetical protein
MFSNDDDILYADRGRFNTNAETTAPFTNATHSTHAFTFSLRNPQLSLSNEEEEVKSRSFQGNKGFKLK